MTTTIGGVQQMVYETWDRGSGADNDIILSQYNQAIYHFEKPVTRRAVADVMGDAFASLSQVESAAVRREALYVLHALRREIAHYDLSAAPSMTPTLLEDGSLVVEWIFDDRRLGLSFDPMSGESGWFFVSLPNCGGLRAQGSFQAFRAGLVIELAMNIPRGL